MSLHLYNRKHTPSPLQLPTKRPVSILIFAIFLALSSLSAKETQQDPVLSCMNEIAQQELQQRAETIREIHTVAQAEHRKQVVHTRLLDILGGLPDYKGPLNSRVIGQLRNDSYTIEKLIYQSLPGFYVTANLYRPNRPGRYPAVLLQAGHTQEGKPENQRIAANLAMKGFVVLCFDPIGQGEREQTYDPQLKGPAAGWSVNEHIHAGAQSILVGESVERYCVWHANRAHDRLL